MSLLRHSRKLYREKGSSNYKNVQFHMFESVVSVGFASLISETLGGVRSKCLVSHSSLLTAIYFYARQTFKHKQRPILQGLKEYYEKTYGNKKTPVHRIIRHTLMLENGISMRERRDVFGIEVADELVENVIEALEQRQEVPSEDQLRWSVDVLAKYFQVVDEDLMLSNTRIGSINFSKNTISVWRTGCPNLVTELRTILLITTN